MYVLADFMSTEQHALCDCSYENENISIYLSIIIYPLHCLLELDAIFTSFARLRAILL